MELNLTQNFIETDEILSSLYDEIDGYEFYKYIFPSNENVGELNTHYANPNAVFLYKAREDAGTKRRLRRRIMLNDVWESDYLDFVERNELALCSGLSYRGRTNKIAHAQKMNALVFDLDGVGRNELNNLFLRFNVSPETIRSLPYPTFIVESGSGLHLYYVFEKPIDLYPNIKVQMKSLKYDLTYKLWDYKGTTQLKDIQYQSINQGFRMVGSINEKYGNVVKAYKTGDKVTLDYINQYVMDDENKVDVNKPFQPTKMSLDEAKESYPEWYERVVVKGIKNKKKWDIAGKVHGNDPWALYHWWLKKVMKAKGGHRYFYLMCLAIYGVKCDVPKSQVKKDMYEAAEELKKIEHVNEFTEDDILSALEMYDKEYYNFTIDDISLLSDIPITRNKRNGQKQAEHLEEARAIRDVRQNRKGTKWDDNNGRKNKEIIVREWQVNNPTGSKADCIRGTKLSKPTVYKWWKEELHMTDKKKKENIGVDYIVKSTDGTEILVEKKRESDGKDIMQAYLETLKNIKE